MRSLAVIPPTKLLDALSTNYHLVLTQYYLRSEAYRAFYKRRKTHGDFIIQDNGAAEIKVSIDASTLIDVARELRPNLIVAPDVIYNGPETIERTQSFLDVYYETLTSQGTQIMAVPQGATAAQWLATAMVFNVDSRIAWWGVSMFYTPKFSGSRRRALDAIATLDGARPCHLLGLWCDPYSLLEEKAYPFVRSVDTAKPIEFAMEGLTLTDFAEHHHIDDDYYNDYPQQGVATPLFLDAARANIEELRRIFCD